MISEFNGDFIQWLRGFYYTAKTGSMSAASGLMNRNQSALSHQIKCLEGELGVRLFQGSRAKRELTEEGRYLLARSIHLFEIIEEIQTKIASLPKDLEGEIAIAAMFAVLQYYLADRVTRFTVHYPKIRLRLYAEAEPESLYQKIEMRKVDFGVLCPASVPPNLHFEPLFDSHLSLITPKTGPYAIAESPSLEQIAQFPFVSPPLRSTLGLFLERQFSRYGLTLRVTHMVEHQEALKACVAAGMGISIVDDIVRVDTAKELINVVSLSAFFPPRVYGIVHRRDIFFPPHLKAFIAFLKDEHKLIPPV